MFDKIMIDLPITTIDLDRKRLTKKNCKNILKYKQVAMIEWVNPLIILSVNDFTFLPLRLSLSL